MANRNKRGDSFLGEVAGKGPQRTALTTNEPTWSERVESMLRSMLKIDLPDAQWRAVLTKIRELGEPTDPPVDLNAVDEAWTIIPALKAFGLVFLSYVEKFNSIISELDAINFQVSQLNLKIDALNTEVNNISLKIDTINNNLIDIESALNLLVPEVSNINTNVSLLVGTLDTIDTKLNLLSDIDTRLSVLNTTALSIRTRMDDPFTTTP